MITVNFYTADTYPSVIGLPMPDYATAVRYVQIWAGRGRGDIILILCDDEPIREFLG